MVEVQDFVVFFYDWNEWINFECYVFNVVVCVFNGMQCIIDIVNNYVCISFNFGLILLLWMEKADFKIYVCILMVDCESQFIFGGYGLVMVQVYSYFILLFCNCCDKEM